MTGFTALHWAVSRSKLEAVKLLEAMGAEIDPITPSWGTPLARAAIFGYEAVAEYLLSKGASKEKAIETAQEHQQHHLQEFLVDVEERWVNSLHDYITLKEILRS